MRDAVDEERNRAGCWDHLTVENNEDLTALNIGEDKFFSDK